MSHWSCRSLLALFGASLVLAVALAPGAGARPAVAHTAGTCSVGSGRGYGYSYLTWLWVSKTSCASGKNLAKHHGNLSGWRCTQKILDRSPVQYDAQKTCKRAAAQVQWKYTQNT